jgi:hypothetical protein
MPDSKLIPYLDFSASSDKQLQLLADLLMAQTQDGTLAEVGFVIDRYLQKKVVREHVFWGRDLRSCTLSEWEKKAEIYRIRHFLR